MAGATTGSVEEVRKVSLYVPQDAVDAALITKYGTPLPDLTMEEVQSTILDTELSGEFVSASDSALPPLPETAFIGKFSGSMEMFTGGTTQEIFHFTNFSGAFSGTFETDTPSNAQVYTTAVFGGSTTPSQTGFKGRFKYVKGGSNYMSASIGNPKQITGSFPNSYWTSSAVTTQDINDLSGSRFTGSFTLASGSMVAGDFWTQKAVNDSAEVSNNELSSFGGGKYNSLEATIETAFGLGDVSSGDNTRHCLIGGEFSNGDSLNNITQSQNVALILNIGRGKVFTTSGSISHSLESLSDGLFIDRSPGASNSGNYHSKCQGVDSAGKPKKKKQIVGAKNRVEVKAKQDSVASRVGTRTGRPVTNFR
tara:strand:- start:626 stop:1723 length:1098 start_codon:yes stop_codon:yes gene_type:complete